MSGSEKRQDSGQLGDLWHRLMRRDRLLRAAAQHAGRGRVKRAIRIYRRLLQENPQQLQLLNGVGDLLVRAQRIEEAQELFLQVGARYAQQGFSAKAMAIYRKILRLEPSHVAASERLQEILEGSLAAPLTEPPPPPEGPKLPTTEA